uniref:NADH dehydrogenase subunit 6 n=1 Tax=Pectocera sp. TaxID=2919647 RepID=UPI001F13C596|nr:NADH dehydrogenase subunit 6 [Pectocera sp.]ULQ68877.1 NADH dehydrogenase subunit 6 [Pectocera sp.]
MIQLLYMISTTMTLTFMFLTHPLSMGFVLLIQAILIAMITGLMSHNFWFSYILFMIMIGGMLVLFIYMTSVASNEKFQYSNKLTITMFMMMNLTLLTFFSDSFLTHQELINIDTLHSTSNWLFSLSLSKYLNFPSNMIMLMMIIYLLVALIAVVKITNISYGPLRQKF